MNIVLLEPEIPSNTGNIARTCVCTNTRLHLIRPLGFSLSEKQLKRAGMDYWDKLDLTVYDSYDDFCKAQPDARIFYATTKGQKRYDQAEFHENDFIMFGKESAGIPEEILKHHKDQCIRIPMGKELRSLNLSNSVAIILYEALRQLSFPDLEPFGQLRSGDYLE